MARKYTNRLLEMVEEFGGDRERRGPRRGDDVPHLPGRHALRPLQGRHQPQRNRGCRQGGRGRGLSDPPAGHGRASQRVRGLASAAAAALVATVAGVGGTLPIVLAAAEAVGATPEQASSWVSGLGIATALSALVLSVRYRMPIITAWSTPGAALIASTTGIGLRAAVGAFVLSAVLILLTAAIRPLGKLIERIPASIAAAMLAGVLWLMVPLLITVLLLSVNV